MTIESPDSVAHPVGFGDVAPAPFGFHPDMNVSSSARGLSGKGRNSPTGGIPLPMNERAPITRPTMMAIQAITGAVVLGFHRRTWVSEPTYVVVSRLRRYELRRALPRSCRLNTSRSGTSRCGLTSRRRASSSGVRGIRSEQRSERFPRLPEAAGERPDDELGERQQHHLDGAARKPGCTGERGHRSHPVSGPAPAVGKIRTTVHEPRTVPYRCRRRHDHPGATVVDPPAQLGVLTVEVDRRIEAPERPEQIRTYQEVGRWQDEDVANSVVLFLVDLAGFDDRIDLPEAVHPEADGLQDARFVPVQELGTDGAGVGAVELLDELPECVRGRGDVVVADQEHPVVAVDEAEHFVGGGTEADVRSECTHERRRHEPLDPVLDVLRGDRAGVAACGGVATRLRQEEEHSQVRIVLRGQCGEGDIEPRAGIVDDDDRNDGRGLLGVGFHDGARLAT